MRAALLFFDVLLMASFCQLYGLIFCTDDNDRDKRSIGRHETFHLAG